MKRVVREIRGNAIREHRKDAKLGLNQLARATRVDPGVLSKVENGLGGTSADRLERIAAHLDIPVSVIAVIDDVDVDDVKVRRAS